METKMLIISSKTFICQVKQYLAQYDVICLMQGDCLEKGFSDSGDALENLPFNDFVEM